MKGQVPVFEVVVVAIILFTSFAIFFPELGVTSKWGEAEIMLKGRDITTTIDRLDNINNYVASATLFTDFMIKAIPDQNFVYGTTIDGTVQPVVTVACNCTVGQIQDMLNWIGRGKVNGRDVQIDVLASTLSPIQESDVLVIWGERDLSAFQADILNYIEDGNGVVGIADFPDGQSPDDTYTKIFGIIECDAITDPPCQTNEDGNLDFEVPTSANDIIYQPYKLFHNMPIRSIVPQGIDPESIPVEGNVTSCGDLGFPITFTFKTTELDYWICTSPTAAYIDTNGNGAADLAVAEMQDFTVGGETFSMRYIEVNRTFISIKEGFEFEDFTDNPNDVFVADLDTEKIFVRDGPPAVRPIPAVVFNTSGIGVTAWMPDSLFPSSSTHDRRLLMQSVILAVANKNSKISPLGDLTAGSVTPYINVVNRDMFEVYQFNLGLGFPF